MRPVAFTLLLGTALAAPACFNAPSAAVQFSCEPNGEDACPADYECRADGCCHRSDTPDDADIGACKLGGPGATDSTGGFTSGTTTTGTTTDTAPSTATSDATSATSAGTTTGTSSSSTTSSTTISTGTGTSTTTTGTT